MKIVSAQMMAQLELQAYQNGFQEKDFMEQAGFGIALATETFIQKNQLEKKIWLLCGKGNNGGDAFVAGRHLIEKGYQVTAVQLEETEHCSSLCQYNRHLFLNKQGKIVYHTESFGNSGVILDGLFGTGFKGQVHFPYDALIQMANQCQLPILAIDIPSGLNGTTGEIEGKVIHATQTLFLELPKIGFFLEKGWNVVGKLQQVKFGLPVMLIDNINADFELITQERVASFLPSITRNRNKYQTGYVVGLAGHMPGAGLMSSLAAFRGGCGMVRLLYPKKIELGNTPYELIKVPYEDFQEVQSFMQKASAIFLGPGLGRDIETQQLLKHALSSLNIPCVIDADALHHYANEAFKLPSQTIFTPHTGEMQTLLKLNSRLTLNLETLNTCQNYADQHHVTLVLKGAPTFIFQPYQKIFINPTGDPGMATAGSGDVLTGLLASLLSQGLNCHQTALLSVYLHGLAGEFAVKQRKTSYGMMATDLIAHFNSAYAYLQKIKK